MQNTIQNKISVLVSCQKTYQFEILIFNGNIMQSDDHDAKSILTRLRNAFLLHFFAFQLDVHPLAQLILYQYQSFHGMV